MTDEQIKEIATAHFFNGMPILQCAVEFARALLAAGASEGQEPIYQERATLLSSTWFDVSITEYRERLDIDGPDWVRIVYLHPSAEIAALRKERDELLTALADCRGACPIPDAGSDLEGHWAAAMGNPGDVPGFVADSIAALRERIAGMEKDAIDAARYRKVRSMASSDMLKLSVIFIPEDFDHFVDAAIAKEKQG